VSNQLAAIIAEKKPRKANHQKIILGVIKNIARFLSLSGII
jgi:hypothetical protein